MPWNATARGYQDWANERKRAGSGYNTAGTHLDDEGNVRVDAINGPNWAAIGAAALPAAVVAGPALAGMFSGGAPGAAGAASGATSGVSAAPLTPLTRSITAPLLGGSGAGSAASGAGSMFGKFLSKLDPTALLLGGLSLFGGDPNERQSFKGTSADPVQALTGLMEAIKRLGGQMGSRGPFTAGSSFVPKGPEPVSIPGIPFQIGGGLGLDPALMNQELLTAREPLNPFGGGQAAPRGQATRRRTPRSGGEF